MRRKKRRRDGDITIADRIAVVLSPRIMARWEKKMKKEKKHKKEKKERRSIESLPTVDSKFDVNNISMPFRDVPSMVASSSNNILLTAY